MRLFVEGYCNIVLVIQKKGWEERAKEREGRTWPRTKGKKTWKVIIITSEGICGG